MYYYNEELELTSLPNEIVVYLENNLAFVDADVLQACEPTVEYFTSNLSESFTELLLKYIDNSGLRDCEVYKKAFISRKVFYKIKSEKAYHPSYRTVTMFAIALNLNLQEYEKLLNSATYSLPKNMSKYIVLRYCFENKIYDIDTINTYLKVVCNITLNDL